jgi:hypothetical protein
MPKVEGQPHQDQPAHPVDLLEDYCGLSRRRERRVTYVSPYGPPSPHILAVAEWIHHLDWIGLANWWLTIMGEEYRSMIDNSGKGEPAVGPRTHLAHILKDVACGNLPPRDHVAYKEHSALAKLMNKSRRSRLCTAAAAVSICYVPDGLMFPDMRRCLDSLARGNFGVISRVAAELRDGTLIRNEAVFVRSLRDAVDRELSPTERKDERQTKALLMIKKDPNISGSELARRLGCHRSAISRDPVIQRALKAAKRDPLPRKLGTIDRDGASVVEAEAPASDDPADRNSSH